LRGRLTTREKDLPINLKEILTGRKLNSKGISISRNKNIQSKSLKRKQSRRPKGKLNKKKRGKRSLKISQKWWLIWNKVCSVQNTQQSIPIPLTTLNLSIVPIPSEEPSQLYSISSLKFQEWNPWRKLPDNSSRSMTRRSY
jgi:hypothetical protein